MSRTATRSDDLREVDEGLIDFAFVQSDWLYRASRGKGRYRSAGPNSELRSILSVPAEMLTILAHPIAGVKAITQLAGRRIGYDAPNNYSYLLMRAAVEAARIDVLDSAPDSEANANIPSQICRGRIDAMVTVERHPSASLAGLIGQCGLTLVSLDHLVINQALMGRPDLTPFRIKAGSSPGIETNIDTLGLMAVLVTQAGASIPLIEAVMTTLFESGSNEASQSLFKAPSSDEIKRTGDVAPLHSAAEAYFRQMGVDPIDGPSGRPLIEITRYLVLADVDIWTPRGLRRYLLVRVLLLILECGRPGPSRWEWLLRKRSQRFCLRRNGSVRIEKSGPPIGCYEPAGVGFLLLERRFCWRGTEGLRFPWGYMYEPELSLNKHDKGLFDTMPVGSLPRGISPFRAH